MTITQSSLANQITSGIKQSLLNAVLGFPSSNVLHQYRTFNYRITLAIVSNSEYETQSYKMTGFDYIVFQSHGKNVDGITPGSSETLNKIQSFVNLMSSGGNNRYNFYVDDLYIKSYVAKTKDIATEIKMKVIEPYGIDTFLKSIMGGLSAKGYYTLDRGVNFILKIDFVGYQEDSDEPEVVPYSTRYFPLVITKLDANLTEKGTVYDVTAAPMNDMARLEDVHTVSNNISIVGKSVGDVISDLEKKLNNLGKSSQDKTYVPATQYKIEWDLSTGDSGMLSKMKSSEMFNEFQDTVVKEFLKDKSAYTSVKQKISTTDQNDKEQSFTQLTVDGKLGITNIIDGILCESNFSVKRIKAEFNGEYNKDGHIDWWRVVPQIKNGQWIKTHNRFQKIITYKIVNRVVHYSKLTSTFRPDHITKPSDYETLTARVYEWNYTGNNKDIISFNLNFNQLWTKIITGDYGKKPETYGASKMTKNQTQEEDPKSLESKSSTNNSSANVTSSSNSVVTQSAQGSTATINGSATTMDTNAKSSKDGQIRSGAETDPFYDMARDVNAIINNPYEQVSMTMEILGDPMWLGTQYIDSGSVSQGSSLFTVDGGIAIRTVDPVVQVLAYAPTDFNSQGFLAPEASYNKSLSMYSAFYTIYEVEHFFSNGVFKQKIKGYRNTEQDMSRLNSNKGDRFTANKIDLSIRGNNQ